MSDLSDAMIEIDLLLTTLKERGDIHDEAIRRLTIELAQVRNNLAELHQELVRATVIEGMVT